MDGLKSAWVGALCVVTVACSEGNHESDASVPPQVANAGSSGSDAGTGGAPSGGAGGAGGNTGDGGAGVGGESDAGPDAGPPVEELVPLPDGSREVDHVANLVNAEAAEELDAFLRGTPPMHAVLRQRLVESVNLFLEHYEEVHDFLFVFTDHSVTDTTTVGAYESLNRTAAPGGGNEIEVALGGYRTTGRLRGVIGVQWRTPVGPPLSHEIMHEWAVHLDPSLAPRGRFSETRKDAAIARSR